MDVETTAETLSPIQRRGVLNARFYEPDCWIVPVGSGRGMVPAGIAVRSIDGIVLNDFGIRVRDHLMANKSRYDLS